MSVNKKSKGELASSRHASSVQQQAEEVPDLVHLCSFQVGEESYVLDIMRIREIIRPIEPTPVRHGSPLVEGVIDLRGDVIPVVDLRLLLGLEETKRSRATKQIIASVQGKLVGLTVDAVGRVIVVPRSEVRPLPTVTGKEGRSLPGVVSYRNHLYLLLNLGALLAGEGISRDQLLKVRKGTEEMAGDSNE